MKKSIWFHLASLFSDYERDFDIFKLLGVVCFAIAIFVIFRALDIASQPNINPVVLTTVAGLVAAPITMGINLFSQARKNDESQMRKGTNP